MNEYRKIKIDQEESESNRTNHLDSNKLLSSINYLNYSYSINKFDSSCGGQVTPTEKSDIITTTDLQSSYNNSAKKQIPIVSTVSNNFYINFPVMNANEMSDAKEQSLEDLGFMPSEIVNWDKIVQPPKVGLMELIEKMLKNYDKTNVQIKIQNTTFNCHMIVLQCYSDFFMELTNEQTVILPPDKVSPQAFVMVYEWMLSTDKPIVKREGILELFNAAQFLRIKGLVDQCWVCLDDDERFCEDAAFLLYIEARKFGHELIQQLMLNRVCKFFLTLVSTKDFLQLTIKEVCTLLQSNAIGVNSETEVLMSAIRWLNYNWTEREKFLLDVMNCVRFSLMTPWQLVELKKKAESQEITKVVEVEQVRKMIDDALSYVTTKYWYNGSTENYYQLMERLELIEPIERQWIRDVTWTENFECPYQSYCSYSAFLKYLAMIRKCGKNHWKSLQCFEGNPNVILQKHNTQNYKHKYIDSVNFTDDNYLTSNRSSLD